LWSHRDLSLAQFVQHAFRAVGHIDEPGESQKSRRPLHAVHGAENLIQQIHVAGIALERNKALVQELEHLLGLDQEFVAYFVGFVVHGIRHANPNCPRMSSTRSCLIAVVRDASSSCSMSSARPLTFSSDPARSAPKTTNISRSLCSTSSRIVMSFFTRCATRSWNDSAVMMSMSRLSSAASMGRMASSCSISERSQPA